MVNEILSKELQVKPLAPGEIAIYKVIGAGEPMPNMEYDDGSPVLKAPKLGMAGICSILDPFDTKNPNKTITYSPTTRPIRDHSGMIRNEEVIERINFDDSGFLFVGYEDNPKYYYLERCNENRDNPHRNKRKPALFDRVHSNKRAQKDLDIHTEQYEALKTIMEGSIDELKLIATQLPDGMKVNLDNTLDSIKVDLCRIAEKSPRSIIMASSDKDAKRLIQFRDAYKYDVIVWDDKLREWFLKKPSGFEKIGEVKIGVDRFKGLLELTKGKDNVKIYNNIVMLLGKVYKASVT